MRRVATPARTRRRDSRSATANGARVEQAAQHAPPGARRAPAASRAPRSRVCAVARWCTRLASRRSRTGWRSQGSTSARDGVRPRRVARARRRRSRRTPGTTTRRTSVAGRDEVLHGGEDAVARAALACRGARVGQAAATAQPGLAGEDAAAVAGDRLPARRRGSARRRSSRRGARAASTRRGRAAAAARLPARARAISRSSSPTVY